MHLEEKKKQVESEDKKKSEELKSEIMNHRFFGSPLTSENGLTRDEIAEQKKNPMFIKPYREVASQSKPYKEEKFQKLHKYFWEYVDVLITRRDLLIDPVEFSLTVLPGDPICFWRIPIGRIVSVPRHVAIHLRENCTHVTLKFKDKPDQTLANFDQVEEFAVDQVKKDFAVQLAENL